MGQLFLTPAFSAGPPVKVSVVGLTQVAFVLGLELPLDLFQRLRPWSF